MGIGIDVEIEGEKCMSFRRRQRRNAKFLDGAQQVDRSRTGWVSHSTRERERGRWEEVERRRGAKERARRWLHTSWYTCAWGGGVMGSSLRSIKRFFSERSRAAIVFHFARMRHRLFLTFQSSRAAASWLTILEISHVLLHMYT